MTVTGKIVADNVFYDVNGMLLKAEVNVIARPRYLLQLADDLKLAIDTFFSTEGGEDWSTTMNEKDIDAVLDKFQVLERVDQGCESK